MPVDFHFRIDEATEYQNEIKSIRKLFPTDDEARVYLCEISYKVQEMLYAKRPDAIPQIDSISWIFSVFDGVAYTTGTDTKKEIYFSLQYVRGISKPKVDKSEVYGVMVHEMVHVWQHSNGIPGGLLEGIADYVRMKAGGTIGWSPCPNVKERWDVGYRTTAFFLIWLEDRGIVNFIANLNGNLKYRAWDKRMIEEFSGVPVKESWRAYQSELLGKKVVLDVTVLKSGKYVIQNKANKTFLAGKEGESGTSQSKYYWDIFKTDNGYVIVDPVSSKALDVYAYATANGSNIVLWERNGGANQNWDISKPQRLETDPPLAHNEFLIVSEHSGKALVDQDGIVQWDIHTKVSQTWIIE
jgi:hypothetical protein